MTNDEGLVWLLVHQGLITWKFRVRHDSSAASASFIVFFFAMILSFMGFMESLKSARKQVPGDPELGGGLVRSPAFRRRGVRQDKHARMFERFRRLKPGLQTHRFLERWSIRRILTLLMVGIGTTLSVLAQGTDVLWRLHSTRNATELRLDFLTQSNWIYQVQSSVDLRIWAKGSPALPGNGQTRSLTVTYPATNGGAQYFRVAAFPSDQEPFRSLVWIPPGTFLMGSSPSEQDRRFDEGPQTQVILQQGYWIEKNEVTQAEYQSLMGANPSFFSGTHQPVEQVTWPEATEYCAELTRRERAAQRLPLGYQYRLPTEAEWEYACRAGTTSRFSYGDDVEYSQLFQYAWYGVLSGSPAPVSLKRPNPWGIYDMHGNVWEWCQDWYQTALPGGAVVDPAGPLTGARRSKRGGAWFTEPAYCRSASRDGDEPSSRFMNLGFRVVLGLQR